MNRHTKASSARSSTRRRRLALSALVVVALVALGAATAIADTAPTPAIETPTAVEYTTAHLIGTVNPNGGPSLTHWHFEYSKDPVNEGWSPAPDHELSQAESEESTALAVSEDLANGTLAPDSTYFVRLVASNDGGQNESAEEELETKAVSKPTVSVPTASALYTTAKASGEVTAGDADPAFNSPCHFDYVTDEHFTAEGFENPGQASCDVEPTGTAATPVSADLAGLTPGTTYHLRLVATNAGGTSSEPAASTFDTLAVAKPTVSIEEVTTSTDSTATFVGHVNPNAPEAEGSTSPAEQGAFETSWHFECVAPGPSCGNLSGTAIPAGNAAKEVTVDAKALEPNKAYYVVLVASNAGGSKEATTVAQPSFTTGALVPTVKAWAAGPIGPTAADINAQVNPHNSPTKYWFEWGTQDCETSSCQALPATKDGDAGDGPIFVYVSRHLGGLEPSTTYHFRVVAKNAIGTVPGADQTFTTAGVEPACTNAGMPGANTLPNCRAYEMVSPPDKNGADVLLNSYKTFAAEVGDGVSYPAMGAFTDARGTSVDVQYLSRRNGAAATNGWSTHAINPPGGSPTLKALVLSNVPSFTSGFTPDLRAAIYRSWRPLTDAPNVASVSNLYRIRDLDAGAPAPQLLTDSAQPLAAIPQLFKLSSINAYAATSKDLSHVIFQSPWSLTGDGGFNGFSGGNLYEYADGVGVRTVGRIPQGPETECDDQGGSPCTGAAAQAGIPVDLALAGAPQYSGGMISGDGSRILFQTPVGALEGTIYLREDGAKTYQLNASERKAPESPGTARIWDMSADGSRVFFTTAEGLVDGDDGGASDLYMYDVTAPAGSHLTLVSVDKTGGAPFVRGVVGASADGHYVYFISDEQLVPGEPSSVATGLYVWHDGEIAYIGQFALGDEVTLNSPRTTWVSATQTKTSRVTPDGRHLLFVVKGGAGFAGRGGYPGYDHGSCDYGGEGPCRELFLYSADSGHLTCVSCNSLSAVATDNALTDVRAGASASVTTDHLSHALSDDGRYAFFSTAESLLAEDTNGKWDAYEYDARSGDLHLISSGTDSADSYYLDSSPDGADVFFATRQQLVGWDTDNAYDLYDARRGGGFPEPAPLPAACEGESCQLAARPSPPPPPAASQASGPGNRSQRCPKGKHRVRRKGKSHCAKAKKHKPAEKRHASSNGGAGK